MHNKICKTPKATSESIAYLLIMNTAATLAIFILGACFYMSATALAPRQTEANSRVAKAADFIETDPCLLCNILMQHICEELIFSAVANNVPF
jgi:hypothetical protein